MTAVHVGVSTIRLLLSADVDGFAIYDAWHFLRRKGDVYNALLCYLSKNLRCLAEEEYFKNDTTQFPVVPKQSEG